MSELAYAMTPPTREERSASLDSAQSDVDNVLKVASALREFNTLLHAQAEALADE